MKAGKRLGFGFVSSMPMQPFSSSPIRIASDTILTKTVISFINSVTTVVANVTTPPLSRYYRRRRYHYHHPQHQNRCHCQHMLVILVCDKVTIIIVIIVFIIKVGILVIASMFLSSYHHHRHHPFQPSAHLFVVVLTTLTLITCMFGCTIVIINPLCRTASPAPSTRSSPLLCIQVCGLGTAMTVERTDCTLTRMIFQSAALLHVPKHVREEGTTWRARMFKLLSQELFTLRMSLWGVNVQGFGSFGGEGFKV